MGFLGFFKKIKLGNFGLIARNITSIYLILKEDFADRFPDEKSLLATAGAIDARKYIDNVQMFPAHMQSFANSAFNNDEDEFSRLVNFVLRMEQEMFKIDSGMDTFQIMLALEEKEDAIKEAIQDVISEYRDRGKLSKMWRREVHRFMNDYSYILKKLGADTD